MCIFLSILSRLPQIYDSHSVQLTLQIAYYFLQPTSYKAVLKN